MQLHWKALVWFNTIFDHLVVSYFLGHPVERKLIWNQVGLLVVHVFISSLDSIVFISQAAGRRRAAVNLRQVVSSHEIIVIIDKTKIDGSRDSRCPSPFARWRNGNHIDNDEPCGRAAMIGDCIRVAQPRRLILTHGQPSTNRWLMGLGVFRLGWF